MSLDSVGSDQASFLSAREPSIWGWDQRKKFVAPVRKHLLLNEIIEEDEKKIIPEISTMKTYLRLKPSGHALDQATLLVLNDSTITTNAPKDSAAWKFKSGRVVHQYTFSKVFGEDTVQKDIFNECLSHQMKDFILGKSCLLFAYGTTNAGKTFTIQGDETNPGLIPRAIDFLFKSIHGQVTGVGRIKPVRVDDVVQLTSSEIAQELEYKNRILHWNWEKPLEPIKAGTSVSSRSNSESDFISSTFREMQKTLTDDDSLLDVSFGGDHVYSVWVSFAEIYNEYIYDLLDPIVNRSRKRIPLKMAQDSEGKTFIRDLKMIHVTSGDEAFHVMSYGKGILQVAATNMNSVSSRSHCIFSVKLVRYTNSDNPSYAIVSSFTFCDLAGAERTKRTLNVGDRLKESNNINNSLHVLGRCLTIIRENQKKVKKQPVPYRDSKLTRILQRALTGHEGITMIVNANPSPILFDDTVNVLNFSAMAKQITLENPIKRTKPAIKKSRFSMMVTRPNPDGTICWDASTENTSMESNVTNKLSSDMCVQKYNARNEELLALVDKLKHQLTMERKKNINLEREVRVEVTGTFSAIISDMENTYRARMQEVQESSENLNAWRISQVENFYKQKLDSARKRRRESDCDESVIECDSTVLDQEKNELKQELQDLEDKYNAVHQLWKEAQDIQSTLSAEISSLKFVVSNTEAELVKCQRQLKASEKQIEGSSDALSKELQELLTIEKQKSADEMKKNENMKELLDEAKQDFVMLTKDKDELEAENAKFQNELLEKHHELSELTQQMETSQLLLAQKSCDYDTLEEKYESLCKTYEQTVKDFEDKVEAMRALEGLQNQLQSLSVCSEGCVDSVSECSEGGSNAIQQIILAIKKKDELCEQMKNDLGKQQEEIKILQKDLKDMLQKNIQVDEELQRTKVELESSQSNTSRLEQELKSVLQKSNSQLNTSASSELESLRLKDKSYDDNMKFFQKWKEEADHEKNRLKGELTHCQEKTQRLEDELKVKENEIENIHTHRSELISRYEEALKKNQEELEREKREVIKLRDTLYKSTPTPKKGESAELRQMKELVESLQTQLSLRKTDCESGSLKVTKSVKKGKKTDPDSSSESLKENLPKSFSVPNSKSKKTTDTDSTDVPNSESKVNQAKDMPPLPSEPASEKKSKRRARKLFSRQDSVLADDVEFVQGDYLRTTTPESFVKRSLRNRKL